MSGQLPGAYSAEVGARFRRLRESRGLSLRAVERLSGGEFKQPVTSMFERGARGMTLDRFAALCAVYGVRPADMLPEPALAGSAFTAITAVKDAEITRLTAGYERQLDDLREHLAALTLAEVS